MSADKVVSKDPTKWTLNLLKDNCYEWTESGSIADVRERYLLLKASLFVGIIDLISPHAYIALVCIRRVLAHQRAEHENAVESWPDGSHNSSTTNISETSFPPLVVSEGAFPVDG